MLPKEPRPTVTAAGNVGMTDWLYAGVGGAAGSGRFWDGDNDRLWFLAASDLIGGCREWSC